MANSPAFNKYQLVRQVTDFVSSRYRILFGLADSDVGPDRGDGAGEQVEFKIRLLMLHCEQLTIHNSVTVTRSLIASAGQWKIFNIVHSTRWVVKASGRAVITKQGSPER